MCQHYIINDTSPNEYDPELTKKIRKATLLKAIKLEILEAMKTNSKLYLLHELAECQSLLNQARAEMINHNLERGTD